MQNKQVPKSKVVYLEFGYSNNDEFEQAILELARLKYGEYGKKINSELLRAGKLTGKTFIDLTHPSKLELITSEYQWNYTQIAEELAMLNRAIEFSYNLIKFFHVSAEYEKSVCQTIKTSMLSPVLYFEVQGHYTLECMVEKLLSDPIGYFVDKAEADRKAA